MIVAVVAIAFTSITNTEDVRDVVVLHDGSVAAATGGGVDVFDRNGRMTHEIRVEHGLPSHETWSLREHRGTLFVATSAGLAVIDDGRAEAFGLGVSWHGLPEPRASETAVEYKLRLSGMERSSPGGFALFVRRGNASAYADVDGRLTVMHGEGVRRFRLQGTPLAGAFDRNGGLRIATSESLYLITRHHRLRELGPLSGPLAARAVDGSIIVSDRHGTLYEAGAMGVRRLSKSLPSGTTTFTPDLSFAGIRGDGLHRIGAGRLTPRGQICSNHVTSIAKHGRSTVVGTFDDGACWSVDGRHWTPIAPPAIPSNVVYGVASSGRYLWIATNQGISRYDGKVFRQFSYAGYNPYRLRSLSVPAVLPGVSGKIALIEKRGISWVTERGRFAGRNNQHRRLTKALSVADGAGRYVYLGTEDRGLLRFDGRRWKVYHDGLDLPGNWVTAVDGDASGRALVGTCQNGVALIDPDRPTLRLSKKDGLADDMVTGVALGTPAGPSFIGTLSGLSVMERSRITATYGPREGLADARVATVEILGDEVWVGTEAGLSVGRVRELDQM